MRFTECPSSSLHIKLCGLVWKVSVSVRRLSDLLAYMGFTPPVVSAHTPVVTARGQEMIVVAD